MLTMAGKSVLFAAFRINFREMGQRDLGGTQRVCANLIAIYNVANGHEHGVHQLLVFLISSSFTAIPSSADFSATAVEPITVMEQLYAAIKQ